MLNFLFSPQKFLDPQRILFAAGLTGGQTLVDLGTGSGFYAVAAAKIVGETGNVLAVDVLESALDHLMAEARAKKIKNIKTLRANLEDPSSSASMVTGIADFVVLANITHQIQNQAGLFAEAYRLLRTGGKLIVLEWNDQPGPIGPPVNSRIGIEAIKGLAKKTNLKDAGALPVDNFHYGLLFIK